jgi:hypothetical protein
MGLCGRVHMAIHAHVRRSIRRGWPTLQLNCNSCLAAYTSGVGSMACLPTSQKLKSLRVTPRPMLWCNRHHGGQFFGVHIGTRFDYTFISFRLRIKSRSTFVWTLYREAGLPTLFNTMHACSKCLYFWERCLSLIAANTSDLPCLPASLHCIGGAVPVDNWYNKLQSVLDGVFDDLAAIDVGARCVNVHD